MLNKQLLRFKFLPNCRHLHTIIFMPKKSWASEDQQTWLLARLADFRQAQEAKTTPIFFAELYKNFHEEWPLPSPNAGEISKEDGNEEVAKTVKQKASENVSGSLTT